MKGTTPQMPRREHTPRDDEFLAWFASLSLERQQEAVRIAERIQQESFPEVPTAQLVPDGLLHIPPSIDTIFLLN